MKEFVFELRGSIYSGYNGSGYVKYFIDKAGAKPIRLKVNSYGGDVNEALAIANLIKEHGDVTIEFIGFNASAVTFMAFAAKSIEMHEDAFWLAHKASFPITIWDNMNMDDIDGLIKSLESKKKSAEAIDLMIASKYAKRSGKSVKDALDLMTEERWMPASEAIEWKFVDKIISSEGQKVMASNEFIQSLEARGLPIKGIALDGTQTQKKKTDDEPVTRSFLKSLVDGLFGAKNVNNAIDNTVNNSIDGDVDSSQSIYAMNKDFIAVNSLLKVDGLEIRDEKLLVSSEQCKAINDALELSAKEKLDDVKAKDDAIKAKVLVDNQVSDAIKVLDDLSDDVKAADSLKDKLDIVCNLLKKLPAMADNDGDVDGYQAKSFKDVALDPINNFDEY